MSKTILKNGTTDNPVDEIKSLVERKLKGVGKIKKQVKSMDRILREYVSCG